MNYAEDRLDRRAREAGSTHDRLASDLGRAREAFEPPTSWRGGPCGTEGRNREATFHFGMAWRLCHWLEENADGQQLQRTEGKDEVENEWRACGDYAQMCELAGFPEVGILALLFYRADGKLEMEAMVCKDRVDQGMRCGCGCGYTECGASHCFVAFPSHSPVVGDILQALDALAVSPGGSFPTASDILAHLASLTRKAVEDPVRAMHAFLSERQVMGGVPSILRYWENADAGTDAALNQRRTLPPVILLLLLKVLFASPIAGPFLQLACISLPYLAARFPTASAEGRGLARDYKSHWAYYVFVRALVLGERVKKHKQGKGIRHTPVWNVVFGLDACRRYSGPALQNWNNLHLNAKHPTAGEIDCREGIGGSLLEGYYANCDDAVERTVVEYLTALTGVADEYKLQILVMPVAPHAYRSEKNGKSLGRAKRRETMCLWNEVLRRELSNASQKKYERVFLLDYEKQLQHPDIGSPVGYVLHPSYNADWTHVNSAVVPLVEDAIVQSGCDLDLL
ncbi:hypothetical protein ACHAXT_002938 [Thalassiosira profunda]